MSGRATKADLYRKVLAFPSNPPDLQCEFGKLGVLRIYGPCTELLKQGAPADDVYLIHEEIVKLVWTESKGRETIVGLRSRGWFLGAPSAITAQPCPTTAATLVRSIVERVPADEFRDRLQNDADLAWKIHQIQSRELCEQLNWLGELACCSARSRLANVLRRFLTFGGASSEVGSERFRLPLKRKEIAELIAVTPEHLSRLLHTLTSEGYIQLQAGWIVIPNPKELAGL